MFLDLLSCLLLFFVIVLGLAWPLAARLALEPAEKLVAAVALSLLGVFLLAWAVYVFALPTTTLWGIPVLAVAGLGVGWRPLVALWREPVPRALGWSQLAVTGWCLGWLALVKSYSGGTWVGDWFGHLQRAWFFLEHWPRDILFNGFDALTSRPPLANLVTGAVLAVTHKNFAHYQIASTLLSSLAFLPGALLAHRWGGRRAIAVFTVLFMLSPLVVQNATFTWTKLPAAFFCLTALYFFLRARDEFPPPTALALCAATLAAGILTHYSAGPYAVLLAVSWLVFPGHRRERNTAWWRATVRAAGVGGLVLATWFGWALAVYGTRGTFLTSSTVTDQTGSPGAQFQVVALNLRDTLVPHFLRAADFSVFSQVSASGWWRDWFFSLYQTNLFFAFGSVAGAAIVLLAAREWRRSPHQDRLFWAVFFVGVVFLGVATHGARDDWGLVRISLQPLVILGLAFLAARWTTLGRLWQLLLVGGATIDLFLGVLLQFGVENGGIDRWLFPTRSTHEILNGYSPFGKMNLLAKEENHWVFVGDWPLAQPLPLAAFLVTLLFVGLWRTREPHRDVDNALGNSP